MLFPQSINSLVIDPKAIAAQLLMCQTVATPSAAPGKLL